MRHLCTHLVYLQIMRDGVRVTGRLRHGRRGRGRGRGRKRARPPGSFLLGISRNQNCWILRQLLTDALALEEADDVVQLGGLP